MAKVITDNAIYKAIADKFREVNGTADGIFPKDMPSEVGKSFESGKSAKRKEFWEAYQDYSAFSDFAYYFSGKGWSDLSFDPIKTIKPLYSANNMFYNSRIEDLAGILARNNVELDLSSATRVEGMFKYAKVKYVPEISCVSATNLNEFCMECGELISVEKLILNSNRTLTFANAFYRCYALSHIIFEGVIGSNLNVQYCPLDKESIESIINCLSATTSSVNLALNKAAVAKAFETSEGALDGDVSTEWNTLVETKPNWNISLY